MSIDEVTAVVERLIRELVPEFQGNVLPSSSFEEIGIDSLSRVDLVVGAEGAFGISIPDSALRRLITVQDLADYVATARNAEGVAS